MGGQDGEEVDGVAVGVQHGGVALAPEGVPRLDGPLVASGGEPGVEGVDLLGALLAEGEGDAVPALGRGVVRVEGADDIHCVPGERGVVIQAGVHMRLGLSPLGDRHTERAVEGEGGVHVAGDDPDESQCQCHGARVAGTADHALEGTAGVEEATRLERQAAVSLAVVVAAGDDVDIASIVDAVDEPVLISDASRPVARQLESQGLGLADPIMPRPLYVAQEEIDALEHLAVVRLPPQVVLPRGVVPCEAHVSRPR